MFSRSDALLSPTQSNFPYHGLSPRFRIGVGPPLSEDNAGPENAGGRTGSIGLNGHVETTCQTDRQRDLGPPADDVRRPRRRREDVPDVTGPPFAGGAWPRRARPEPGRDPAG